MKGASRITTALLSRSSKRAFRLMCRKVIVNIVRLLQINNSSVKYRETVE